MTQNQIAYWELEEKKRSNRVQEKETMRHNFATESIQAGTLDETRRHNTVSEGIAFGNLAETERSNKARENETHRSNVANEALKHESNLFSREVGMAQVAESNRHNVAMENENARHDVAMEEYSYFQTNTQRLTQKEQNELRAQELELAREELYGGKNYDNPPKDRSSDSSHGFSGSGKGDFSFEGSTNVPTLERELEEKKLYYKGQEVLQKWFSTGGDLINDSLNIVRNLSYLIPTN